MNQCLVHYPDSTVCTHEPTPTNKSVPKLPFQHHFPLCLWTNPLFQTGQPTHHPKNTYHFSIPSFILWKIPNTYKSINNSLWKPHVPFTQLQQLSTLHTYGPEWFWSKAWTYHCTHNYFSTTTFLHTSAQTFLWYPLRLSKFYRILQRLSSGLTSHIISTELVP